MVFQSFFCSQLSLTFFMVQAFQGPGFLGSRFFRVWVQALEVARSINMFIEEHVNMQCFYKAFVKLL